MTKKKLQAVDEATMAEADVAPEDDVVTEGPSIEPEDGVVTENDIAMKERLARQNAARTPLLYRYFYSDTLSSVSNGSDVYPKDEQGFIALPVGQTWYEHLVRGGLLVEVQGKG